MESKRYGFSTTEGTAKNEGRFCYMLHDIPKPRKLEAIYKLCNDNNGNRVGAV